MPKHQPDSVRRESGDGVLGAYEALLFSDSGGLTQFGAFVEILAPGARSSHVHWHEDEDEMVYMLEGSVVLVEGEDEVPLEVGEAATFPAGQALGHRLENRSDSPARYLVIGTRAPRDRVHYPGEDRVLHVERSGGGARRWTTESGAPAEPLPK
ncbi:cupin domain-containing protein [Ponticoccus alexandrii]|uniref:Cupin domain-containing protein n=1 Tax=Ponticoccus alexandrii TaxID=1943633 RepID=A0ABX7F6C2_9RHOB|nr:cupin domain-containing protein [Ponticoccus alexandrii]ETA50127.1 cupin [Rhodobacteraceae bacterium PD-2]QRF65741.1 cupin domain-containing protein [Ponticoccus alexandrii]